MAGFSKFTSKPAGAGPEPVPGAPSTLGAGGGTAAVMTGGVDAFDAAYGDGYFADDFGEFGGAGVGVSVFGAADDLSSATDRAGFVSAPPDDDDAAMGGPAAAGAARPAGLELLPKRPDSSSAGAGPALAAPAANPPRVFGAGALSKPSSTAVATLDGRTVGPAEAVPVKPAFQGLAAFGVARDPTADTPVQQPPMATKAAEQGSPPPATATTRIGLFGSAASSAQRGAFAPTAVTPQTFAATTATAMGQLAAATPVTNAAAPTQGRFSNSFLQQPPGPTVNQFGAPEPATGTPRATGPGARASMAVVTPVTVTNGSPDGPSAAPTAVTGGRRVSFASPTDQEVEERPDAAVPDAAKEDRYQDSPTPPMDMEEEPFDGADGGIHKGTGGTLADAAADEAAHEAFLHSVRASGDAVVGLQDDLLEDLVLVHRALGVLQLEEQDLIDRCTAQDTTLVAMEAEIMRIVLGRQ